MNNRKIAVKFSGGADDQYKDGQMTIKYLNVFSNSEAPSLGFSNWDGGRVDDYSDIFPDYLSSEVKQASIPIIVNYTEDKELGVSEDGGLCALSSENVQNYSIYRREYEIYERPGIKIKGYYLQGNFYKENVISSQNLIIPRKEMIYVDINTQYYYSYNFSTNQYNLIDRARIYKSEWEPVTLQNSYGSFYDFNIKNGHSYQYIMYPNDNLIERDDNISDNVVQIFANGGNDIIVWVPDEIYFGQGKTQKGSLSTSNLYGAPVVLNWDEWSICELIPQKIQENAPIVKKAFKVNLDQIWLFKYSLETGAQTQNVSRSDFQTLGQFPKIGYGSSNYESGEVTALMGSEIIPYKGQGYIERLKEARSKPLSTNERIKMLEQWRKFVSSKNPKLLKDIKGQSWIVQVISASNSPKNLYIKQPDTISLQWKQIDDTKNITIISEIKDMNINIENKHSSEWEPIFKNKKY